MYIVSYMSVEFLIILKFYSNYLYIYFFLYYSQFHFEFSLRNKIFSQLPSYLYFLNYICMHII